MALRSYDDSVLWASGPSCVKGKAFMFLTNACLSDVSILLKVRVPEQRHITIRTLCRFPGTCCAVPGCHAVFALRRLLHIS